MNGSPAVKEAPLAWLLGFLLLYTALVLPRIFTESPTNDEPIEITNGYFYWQGDVVSHNHHPPLPKLLQSLPLRFLPLKAQAGPPPPDYMARAYEFFFILNCGRFELTTRLARCATLLMGLGIGCLLFFLTRRCSLPFHLSVMGLWVFEPNLQAYSGLAMADVPVTFFFLASVLAFRKHQENPGSRAAAAAGLLTAMAVTCKFSALVLIPLFVGLEWLEIRKAENLFRTLSERASDWAWGAVSFLAWIFILYLPGSLLLPDHQVPWTYFLKGLSNMMDYSSAHHPSFFMGTAGRRDHWLYYPAALILKSALPFLILVFGGILWAVPKKITIPAWIWGPALLGFVDILPVQNLGVRYLLPIYPFLILIAALAAEKIWSQKFGAGPKIGKILVLGLGLWQATTVLANYPKMISYFNDFVPAESKIGFLGDSNLDLGQDLDRLAQTATRRGWKKVKLAQYGVMDPSLYGMAWEPWTENDLKGPQPGNVYAMNASFVQLAPVFYPELIPIASGWISRTKPSGQVGDTWFYFEIPGNPIPDSSRLLPSVQTLKNHAPKQD